MRGPPPQVPEAPYYDRIQEEEERAERAREAEGGDHDGELRDSFASVGRGRSWVYILVALAIAALVLVAYLLATYLYSL